MTTLLAGPIAAAYHVVSALAGLIRPLAGGLSVAAAIVLFTVAVRLLILPISFYAVRGQLAQARIAGEIQTLREQHGKQSKELSRELKALHIGNNTSTLTGCLPLLLQWPFLATMYLLFRSVRIGGQPNRLLAHYLLGVRLSAHWLTAPGPLSGQGAVFAGLFVILAAMGLLTARIIRRVSGPGAPTGAVGWLVRVAPFLTASFAFFLPLATGLYLLTTLSWTALERAVLPRFAVPRAPSRHRKGARLPFPGPAYAPTMPIPVVPASVVPAPVIPASVPVPVPAVPVPVPAVPVPVPAVPVPVPAVPVPAPAVPALAIPAPAVAPGLTGGVPPAPARRAGW